MVANARARLLRFLAPALWRAQVFLWVLTRATTVGVKLVLLRDGRVVLVRHSYRPGWYLPGGAMKRGETIEDAARRELREELGVTAGSLDLIGVFSDPGRVNNTVILLAAEEFTAPRVASWELTHCKAFETHALPRTTAPSDRARVHELAAGLLPTMGRW